jgi:putative MATE family efflux protein
MKDLTRGGEARALVFFSVPMLLGNVFQQFYNMVDSIVVGNFVGKTALAAVGASFPVIFLMVALIMGLTMGATVLVAQFFGARQFDRIRATVDTTYIALFWSGIVVSVLGVLGTPWILGVLDIPADAAVEAATYLRILFAGMLGMFGYNAVSAILRGLGDSKTPLYILIFSSLTNVVLDLLFVIAFGWGVAGVAWATVISQGLSFVGALLVLDSRNRYVRLSIRDLRFDPEIFRISMKIGLPTGLQQTAVASGHMVLMRIVNGFGTDVTAGFTAAGRLDSFAMMPAMNLSQAMSTFTGQNIGAGRTDRVRRGLRAGLALSLAASLFTGLAVILFGRELVSIFSRDPGVVSVGERYLLIAGPFYLLFSIMFLVNGVLRGAGDAVIPLFTTLLALWVVRVPCAIWFSSFMGPDGVWWAMPAGWTVGCIASMLYYSSGRWKSRALVKPAAPAAEE